MFRLNGYDYYLVAASNDKNEVYVSPFDTLNVSIESVSEGFIPTAGIHGTLTNTRMIRVHDVCISEEELASLIKGEFYGNI